MIKDYFTPENVEEYIDNTFYSKWLQIDQTMINNFGQLTLDPDPHHIDPDFCAKHSPWGKPIAFGFLTLSLITPLLYQVFRYKLDGNPETDGYPASFGTDYLRMVSPVQVDSKIRAGVTPIEVIERKENQKRIKLHINIEIEGNARPAIVTDWYFIWFSP